MNKIKRILLGGICQGLIMLVFSIIIHMIIFGRHWDAISFMRPFETWQVTFGMPISIIVFGILISWGFFKLYAGIPGAGIRKGLNYGLIIFLIFMPFVEFWNYFQLKIPFILTLAGILHYLLSFMVGGIVIAAIYGENKK